MTHELKVQLARHIEKKKRTPGTFGPLKSKGELIQLAISDAEQVENHLALHLKDLLEQIGKLGGYLCVYGGTEYTTPARVLLRFLCERWQITPVRRSVR